MTKTRMNWNNKKIIEEIQRLKKSGISISPIYLRKNHRSLQTAMNWHFGNYKNALEAAGFSYEEEKVIHSWSKKEIIKQIKHLKESGEPINARYVHLNYSGLYQAAFRYFGDYQIAVEAAGFDYKEIRRVWEAKKWIKNLTKQDADRLTEQVEKILRTEGES